MKHFALLCVGVALLAACRQADDVVVCGPTATASFADLRAAAPAVQKFSFNLAQAQSFRTSGGATVAFSANAYLLPNGSVATGQAELRVRELYAVPDMLLADMPTTAQSSRQLLVSGGEFNFQVWQGSTRLRMGNGSPTGVIQRLLLTSPVPAAGLDTTRMLLWKQPASSLADMGADSSGWQLLYNTTAATTAPVSPVRVPAVGGHYTAALPLDSVGNWNIDQYWHAYQTAQRGNIGVEVPTATRTHVYFRPVGFNGLARGFAANTPTTRWNGYLPFGSDVIAVVLQERGGQLYYGTQRITTAANQVISPALEALSAAEIIRRVRQL